MDVQIVNYCNNYIHTFYRSKDDGKDWKCTFVHGNSRFSRRRFLWENLKVLHFGNGPWMCIRDFNELFSQEEKEGIQPHCQNKINLFRRFMDNAGLMDIVLKGSKFMWFSNPHNGMVIKERIDRMLVNWEWREVLTNAVVTTLPASFFRSLPPSSALEIES